MAGGPARRITRWRNRRHARRGAITPILGVCTAMARSSSVRFSCDSDCEPPRQGLDRARAAHARCPGASRAARKPCDGALLVRQHGAARGRSSAASAAFSSTSMSASRPAAAISSVLIASAPVRAALRRRPARRFPVRHARRSACRSRPPASAASVASASPPPNAECAVSTVSNIGASNWPSAIASKSFAACQSFAHLFRRQGAGRQRRAAGGRMWPLISAPAGRPAARRPP